MRDARYHASSKNATNGEGKQWSRQRVHTMGATNRSGTDTQASPHTSDGCSHDRSGKGQSIGESFLSGCYPGGREQLPVGKL